MPSSMRLTQGTDVTGQIIPVYIVT